MPTSADPIDVVGTCVGADKVVSENPLGAGHQLCQQVVQLRKDRRRGPALCSVDIAALHAGQRPLRRRRLQAEDAPPRRARPGGIPLRFFRDPGSIIMDTAGVGRVDFVINGTKGNDTIDASGDASGVAMSGLAGWWCRFAISSRPTTLRSTASAATNGISAAALAAQAITLPLDGGAGEDRIAGRRD